MGGGTPATAKAHGPGTRRPHAAAARYTIDGDLRFLSHHDELRMITRALVRAGWPLKYSEGFNPIPRVRLPVPRPVGTASACQVALVELTAPRPAGELHRQLEPQLPAGCRLLETVAPASAGTPHPRRADYVVPLRGEDLPGLAGRIARLLTQTTVSVTRASGRDGPPRVLDIRPCIETLLLEGNVLHMGLAYAAQRTARPSEVLTALDLDPAAYAHRLRRVAVTWDKELAAGGDEAAALEGRTVGQEENDDQEKDQNHEENP